MANDTVLLATIVLLCVGMTTVRSSPLHPTPSIVAYAVDADSTGAWVAARGPIHPDSSVAGKQGQEPPAWLSRLVGRGRSVSYTPVANVAEPAPTTTVLSDSTSGAERRLVLRIVPPPGAGTIDMQSIDTRVLRASIDGRAIDASRYRGGLRSWRLGYSGPPQAGITLGLVVPAASEVSLDLMSRTPGLPPVVQIPARSDNVVTIQTGDIVLVHRVVHIQIGAHRALVAGAVIVCEPLILKRPVWRRVPFVSPSR